MNDKYDLYREIGSLVKAAGGAERQDLATLQVICGMMIEDGRTTRKSIKRRLEKVATTCFFTDESAMTCAQRAFVKLVTE